MADHIIRDDFNALKVVKAEKIFAETGTFRKRIFEDFVCGNRLRSRKNGSISVSKFRKRRHHYFRQINNS